jgi:group I intron endonuclease
MGGGIYIIENTLNGRFYVGSTTDFHRRRLTHLRELREGKHCNSFLQRDWSKCGDQSFRFIEYEHISDRKLMAIREQEYISLYYDRAVNCYNLNPYAKRPSGTKGRKFSQESRARMSAAKKGKPMPDACRRALHALKGKPRKPHAEATKELMRSRRGKVVDVELVSPSGEIHHLHKNIAAFCREHGIEGVTARSSLARVIQGNAISYLGWRLYNVDKSGLHK